MHLTREEIELDPDKDVVKYKMKKTFYFNKEESGCYSQDDQVTVLNAALVVSTNNHTPLLAQTIHFRVQC